MLRSIIGPCETLLQYRPLRQASASGANSPYYQSEEGVMHLRFTRTPLSNMSRISVPACIIRYTCTSTSN